VGFGSPPGRPNVPRGAPSSRKGTPNAHFGVSPGRLLMPKRRHSHLAKTLLFTALSAENPVLGPPDAVRNASLWRHLCMVGSLTPFLCLLWPAWWLEGCQLGLRGSPKGSKKGPQNDQKSIRNPPGRHLACPRVSGGTPQVPPRLPTCIFMHIYAYIYNMLDYLCMF
jgi:hypothetical protein